MERFPALRMILKLGRIGAALAAVLVAVLALGLLWGALGWFAVLPALAVFVVTYFLAKSYVELVQIIVEFVH